MRKFYIYKNEKKDPNGAIYERVCSYLKSRGAAVLDDPLKGAECIIVLGGDGTLISASRNYASEDFVFFGVNLGTVGYLADIEIDDIEASLDKIINDEFSVEERMMLKGEVKKKGRKDETHLSLNDVVINRSGKLCLIDYSIFVNDKFLTLYRADGIIVSTPTGSTGYSLSAGGPIVDPKSKLMIITPICPQSLTARAMVLSEDSSIRIEIDNNARMKRAEVELSFDGRANIDVRPLDDIIITKADTTTRIGRLKEESFVETMRQKLGN